MGKYDWSMYLLFIDSLTLVRLFIRSGLERRKNGVAEVQSKRNVCKCFVGLTFLIPKTHALLCIDSNLERDMCLPSSRTWSYNFDPPELMNLSSVSYFQPMDDMDSC